MIEVSPGAYIAERDFSLYVPALGISTFGVVGSATKGPFDEPTLITDEATLIATFGRPSADHIGMLCAIRYLRQGRQLYFVRVGTYYTAEANLAFDVDQTAGGAVALTVTPTSAGTWVNALSIAIVAGTFAGTYRLTVRETVNSRVYTVEVFDNLLVGAASASNVNYIATRINGVSSYISITIASPVPAAATLEADTYTFSTGTDGIPVDDSDIIGLTGAPPSIPATGLQTLANPETLDISLLAVPGYYAANVIAAEITLAEARADCLVLLTVPRLSGIGRTVQQAIEWHNGTAGGVDDPTAALNSSYAAVFYPWALVYDGYSDSNVWIPLEGHVAGAMAHTDQVADPWWAPAGLNRAMLNDVLDLDHQPTQGERDQMYSYGNAINPICNYKGQGYTIWGQRTLQRAPTALDRINVRRLMIYLEKVIATSVRYLVFEPNDAGTWTAFINLVDPTMDAVKARRGIYDYRIICDETTNTAAVIARSEMVGKILLQPTKAAEMITIEFVLLPTGARFEEFA